MGKKEEVERIVANLKNLSKTINEINTYNNKLITVIAKEYAPAAENLANSYSSDAGMILFQESANIIKEAIEKTTNIQKALQVAATQAENLARAELKAQGIDVPEKPKEKTEDEKFTEKMHNNGGNLRDTSRI
ncbi:hypothetical protein [Butyrivibrio sp. JL13D10]|uniref:hypothetical protein n=1 Tax=Butyrivibrio sp. JL13D10 TaxID=3236815 RepID=UPI0038B67712